MNDIRKFIGTDQLTVSEAMQQIDINAGGILFIVDDDNRLLGCITDGDIRRFLLGGGSMDALAMDAANKEPRYATTIKEAARMYNDKSYVWIPVVDSDGRMIDIYGRDDISKIREKRALHIPVVINAGGKGTRLEPFTKVLPKPLIPVGDYPIIEHIMREYQSYECDDFHVIVNYKRDLIKTYFADSDKYNITWYDEQSPLGTGGGLSLLRGKMKETFFFVNCDVLLRSNYERVLEFHKENGNDITMVCAYKNINIPYGVVEIGQNGCIEEMREKPLISFLTNTGIYVVEPAIIDGIADNENIDFPDIIEKARNDGRKVAAFPVGENDWMDMGQFGELEKMYDKLYG